MSIEVSNETETEIDVKEFVELGRFVLDSLHVHPLTDLDITFVDVKTMTDLHKTWMDEPGPTDVLSFPMDELRPGRPGQTSGPGLLGDVVICPEVAARQAAALGHASSQEMLLLAVHGILHLLGFDHATPDDERVMFELQRSLMLTFLAAD